MCFCCLLYLFAFSAAFLVGPIDANMKKARERERGGRGGEAAGVVGGDCPGMQIAECHRDVDARQLPMSKEEKLNNEGGGREENARKSRKTKIVKEKKQKRKPENAATTTSFPSPARLAAHTLTHT